MLSGRSADDNPRRSEEKVICCGKDRIVPCIGKIQEQYTNCITRKGTKWRQGEG